MKEVKNTSTAVKKPSKKIKDLPDNISLGNVHFRAPDGTEGYWVSQWGYENGKAGIWYKNDPKETQMFPLFLDNLREALEFEVL